MALQVGTTLPLGAAADAPVILRCGHIPLLRGRVGRVADHVAIRIEDKIHRDEGPG
jgi:flagellar motor switch protein FliM